MTLDEIKASLPEIERGLAMLKGLPGGEAPKGPCLPCEEKAAAHNGTYRMEDGYTAIELLGPDGQVSQALRIPHFDAARAFRDFYNGIAAENKALDDKAEEEGKTADPLSKKTWYDLLDLVIGWVDEHCGVRLSLGQADWLYDFVDELIAKKKLTRQANTERMLTSLRSSGSIRSN